MNSSQIPIQNASIDDLLFRGKNKAYGAYQIRKSYPDHIRRSMFYLLVLTLFVFLLGLMISKIPKTSISHSFSNKETVLRRYQSYSPPQKAKPKSKMVSTNTNIAPTIVSVAQVEVETKHTSILSTNSVSTENESLDASSNSGNTGTTPSSASERIETITNIVVDFAEKMPEFPGGEDKMLQYLGSKLKNSAYLQEQGIFGEIFIEFIVNEDGSLSDFSVVKSLDPILDRSAMNAAKSMPKWIPGENGGHPVKVRLQLPIIFAEPD